ASRPAAGRDPRLGRRPRASRPPRPAGPSGDRGDPARLPRPEELVVVTALVDDMDWAQHAACRGLTHLFFPDVGDARTGSAAKAVCAGCPVRWDCLAFALDNHEGIGIWGGFNSRERRILNRWRRLARQRGLVK